MRIITLAIAWLTLLGLHAQVPRNIIVEHTTNTLCGICAARNPGFYTNLAANPNVLHLAIHPSSPYTACIFNQHNVSENDSRTNYYGIYGGTPRLVIQGDVISTGADYSSASIFSPYTGQLTEASITITQTKYSQDSIHVQVSVKTEASHSYGNLRLFVALAEDTIAYNAPNGETEHYDVFRKALTAVTGDVITLPATIGDSLLFEFTQPAHIDWNFDRIYTVAILQDESTKDVIQSNVAFPDESILMGMPGLPEDELIIYPNPCSYVLNLLAADAQLYLYDQLGNLVLSEAIVQRARIDVSELEAGVYLLQLVSNNEVYATRKVVVAR